METIILGYIGFISGDAGKESQRYHTGLYRDYYEDPFLPKP